MDDIEDDFTEKAGDISHIARKRQPALDAEVVLGNPEDLDRTLLHLLVTAEEEETFEQDDSTPLGQSSLATVHSPVAAQDAAALSQLLRRAALSCQEAANAVARFGSKHYEVTFLFFDPGQNPNSSTAHFVVQAEDFDEPICDLIPKVVDVLGTEFNYNAEENGVDFWVVRGLASQSPHEKTTHRCVIITAQETH